MKLIDLTPKQLKRLAALAKTSYDSLRHAATGRRGLSAHAAVRLEHAGRRMKIDLRREDMNAGCKGCEFAKACRKV